MNSTSNLHVFSLAALVFLAACSKNTEPANLTPASGTLLRPAARANADIVTYSSLAVMMNEGKIGPSVWLSSFREQPGLMGLGSLSGLRGEVLLVDGEVWVSYPNDAKTSSARKLEATDETAAFLVVANVPSWQTATVRALTFGELEAGIEELVSAAGLAIDSPVPLVIEGKFENLAFNVVDGRSFEAGQKIPRNTLLAAASKTEFASAEGVIVGFFSTSAVPEFIHPGARLHLHVLLRDEMQVGHVDRVDLPAGARVRLPSPP